MPTYVYRRLGPDGQPDGSTFELAQRITEPALTHDPATGQPVERVISGAGLMFKGSGFYLTDYARKGGDATGEATGGDPKAGDAKPGEAKGDATGDGPKKAGGAPPESGGSADTAKTASAKGSPPKGDGPAKPAP